MLQALGLLGTVLLCACLPGTAMAAQSVRLQATFTPERLGRGTTVSFAFQIATPRDRVPPPVTGIEVSYPVELGFALSELGLAVCPSAALELFGPEGCPTNSLMGYGTALAEIPIGPQIFRETAQAEVFRTENDEGHLALLVYVVGISPVSAQIIFPAVVLPAPAPFGGRLDMGVPIVPSLPGAPDVALVQFRSSLGPLHVTYQERVRGRLVKFKPKGIPLPTRCPRGGFPFAATFAFQDDSQSEASAIVRCPPAHR